MSEIQGSPPSECPMHQADSQTTAPVAPAHQERAYDFVGCPMKAAKKGMSDIDPTNMVLKPSRPDMRLVFVCF